MSFWKIAWRNIEQRALASALTTLSMALGVAAMIVVLVIHSVTVRQFSQDAQGYHLIVGGKGGSLQLVLSTVYHIGQPLYPIPYSYYQKFQPGGEFANWTDVAIPVCLGDSYQAPNGSMFRVVGTTPELFSKIQYGATSDGTPKYYEFQPGGRNLRDASRMHGEEFAEAAYEAVIGSIVAAQSGLKVGDEVHPTHGLSADGHQHGGFKVVGILKPTGTANDRAVFINIEGFYVQEGHALAEKKQKPGEAHTHDHKAEHAHDDAHEHEHTEADRDHVHEEEMAKDEQHVEQGHTEAEPAAHEHAEHDHDHEHGHAHEPLPIPQREVTSVLVLCKNFGELPMNNAVNKGEGSVAQAVAPGREVTILMDRIVGPIRIVLLVLTIVIVVVAGIGILVSIYNSMAQRSHDIAVMRALGASRGAVMCIILAESILLSLGGGLLGILLGHGLIALAAPYVLERTGVVLGLFQFDWQELVLIPALIALAALVGLLPAWAAYKTDVSKSLAGSR